MRILQIIDSLDAGGAERMAVNYANALAMEIEFSGLVATRKEGLLLNQIHSAVSYSFLKKKYKLDLKAIFKLRSYVLKNKVTHIHTHSTSFFLALFVKFTVPSLIIIRHDHYGNNEFLSARPHLALKLTAFFCAGIIVVNHNLKKWSEQKLKAKNVVYLPNFVSQDFCTKAYTSLKGMEGKRIIHLANLRPQKNHFLLLDVAKKLKQSHPQWSFHLVGKDFEDIYSKNIIQKINKYSLHQNVFLYGSREDITHILKQADIAVLTSESEGLPVALLEYGISKKAVVVTSVGDVPLVVENNSNGLISDLSVEIFYHLVVELIEKEELRIYLANRLKETITEKFSPKAVVNQYLNWLKYIKK